MTARTPGPDTPVRERDHGPAMRRVGEALAARYTEVGQAITARIIERT